MSDNLIEFYKKDKKTKILLNGEKATLLEARKHGWVPVDESLAVKLGFKAKKTKAAASDKK